MKLTFILIFVLNLDVIFLNQNYVDAHRSKHVQPLRLGDGMTYPRYPMSTTEAEKMVFGRTLYAINRISNPPLPDTFVTDAEIIFIKTLVGTNLTYAARLHGECEENIFDLRHIQEEGSRAVYHYDEPFRINGGAGLTFSIFSSNPENYVFYFVCFDDDDSIVRDGINVYCDGPWEVAFYTLEYPPNRIEWCDAETDLFNVMGISFDTEFNRFEMTEYGPNDNGAGETVWMHKLVCAFVVRKPQKTGFLTSRSIL